MKEQIDRIADDLAALRMSTTEQFDDVTRQFGEVKRQFGEVNRQFGEVNRQFGEVNRQFGEVNQRFDDLEAKVTRTIQIEHERTRELLQKATEGFAATLSRIDRSASERQHDVDAKLVLHDKVLENHAGRIVALERTHSGPGRS